MAFIRLLLKTQKEDEWDKFLSSININDNSAFKLYRHLLNTPTSDCLLIRIYRPLYSATYKVENFADTFEVQFKTNHGATLPEVDISVQAVRTSTIIHYAYKTPGTVAQIITLTKSEIFRWR